MNYISPIETLHHYVIMYIVIQTIYRRWIIFTDVVNKVPEQIITFFGKELAIKRNRPFYCLIAAQIEFYYISQSSA